MHRYRNAWEDFVPVYAQANRRAAGVTFKSSGEVVFSFGRLIKAIHEWPDHASRGNSLVRNLSTVVSNCMLWKVRRVLVDGMLVVAEKDNRAQDASWVLFKKYSGDEGLWLGQVQRILRHKDYMRSEVFLLEVAMYRSYERRQNPDGTFSGAPLICPFTGMPVFKDEVYKVGGLPNAVVPVAHVAASRISVAPHRQGYRVVLCRDALEMYMSGGYSVPAFWR